jgi:hypothetical protein
MPTSADDDASASCIVFKAAVASAATPSSPYGSAGLVDNDDEVVLLVLSARAGPGPAWFGFGFRFVFGFGFEGDVDVSERSA